MASAPVPHKELFRPEIITLGIKNIALILAALYAMGFLIVSIHCARFGLAIVEPLRPKVFSAGLWFVILIGVPCVAASRLFETTATKPAAPGIWKAILNFWWIAVSIRTASAVVFTPFEFWPRYPGWVFLLVVSAGSVVLYEFGTTRLNTFGMGSISFLFTIVEGFIVFKYASRSYFDQTIWFYLVGLIFVYIRSSRTQEMLAQNWERQLFAVMGLVTFFAVLVYGHINSAFGGGAPIKVDVVFNHATSYSSSKAQTGFLVEQDSYGYYLVHKEDDVETHFIPRDAVTEIIFDGNPRGFR